MASVVQVKLFGAVIVSDVDVRPTVAVEIGRRCSKGPACSADSHFVRDVLELSVSEIVKEKILSTIGRELEAVVHDLRRCEMPQVDVAEIRCDVQVEQAIAVVIDPDSAVAVDPPS